MLQTALFREKREVNKAAGREAGTADFINRVENLTIVRVVRDSLIHIIPVLIIGAFALIVQTFR